MESYSGSGKEFIYKIIQSEQSGLILLFVPRQINKEYGRRRIYQYSEDDFWLNFFISTKLSNSMDTQKP